MDFAISHVLVPVDFSSHSAAAFRYATMLASRLGASMDLLHVVEDPIAAGAWSAEIQIQNLSEIRKNLMDDGERRLDQYRATVKAPSVSVVTAVRMGQPADTITEYAKAFGIDLIVMGTHGRSRLAHLFLGSVAERVVRHAPCPVLTLRGSEQPALGGALGHVGTSRE